MEARGDAEQVSRNVIACQCVDMVTYGTHRGGVGDSVEKFFELADPHSNVIGDRVNLSPIAGGKNYSATRVRREPTKVFPERVGGDSNALQDFNWCAVDIQTYENEIQFDQTYRKLIQVAGFYRLNPSPILTGVETLQNSTIKVSTQRAVLHLLI